MRSLSARDFQLLLNFLRQVYSARDQASYIHCVFDGLPKLIPTDMTSYSEMHVAGEGSQHWTDHPLSKAQQSLWPEVMGEHAVLMHQARTHDGRAYKMSDFLSKPQFLRTRLYNEFYKPHGIEEQMGCLVAVEDPMFMGIAVHRSRRTFKERDRLLLNLVRPHLAQAWRNTQAFSNFAGQLKRPESLDQCETGLVLLEADGRIVGVGDIAQRLLAEFLGCSGSRPQLPDDLKGWITCQSTTNDSRTIQIPRTPFVMEKPGKRLVARLLNVGGRFQLLLQKQISESERNGVHFNRRLSSMGISKRETEVLSWVMQGKSNADIAAILEISPRTVQKHLEHIFQKLGVETRTAAACQVLGQA